MFCPPDPLGWQHHLRGSAGWHGPFICLQGSYSQGFHGGHLLCWNQGHDRTLKPRIQPWWSLSHFLGHSSLFLKKNSTRLQTDISTIQSCRIWAVWHFSFLLCHLHPLQFKQVVFLVWQSHHLFPNWQFSPNMLSPLWQYRQCKVSRSLSSGSIGLTVHSCIHPLSSNVDPCQHFA